MRFFTNTAPFKARMRELINDDSVSDDAFMGSVGQAIIEHKMGLSTEYVRQVTMLRRASRAHAVKLVDCFDDHELTRLGHLVVFAVRWVVIFSLLIGFVLLVIRLDRCVG